MNFLLRIWAIFFLAARRLVARRWLALATALGLVVSIALIMSIPLYSDAVYYRILHEELAKTNEGQSLINRPAFAFMYRYLGSIYGTKKFSDAEAVDAYLSGPAVDQLGIPVSSLTRYLKSDTLRMFPAGDVVNSAFASTEDRDKLRESRKLRGRRHAGAGFRQPRRTGGGGHRPGDGRQVRHSTRRRIHALPHHQGRNRLPHGADPGARLRHLDGHGCDG
jgi:hypothetical protein